MNTCNLEFEGRQLSVAVELITPEMAQQYMGRNENNRPLSKTTVLKYARALRQGEWVLNGEAIVFDSDGRMGQGQHRLEAIINSGIAMSVVVIRGVDPKAFATYDGGRNRRASDILALDGETNTRALASAVSGYIIASGGSHWDLSLLTNSSILEYVHKAPSIRFWVNQFVGRQGARSLYPGSFAGIVAAISDRHGIDVAQEFFDQATIGAGLKHGSPVLLLRDKFTNVKHGQRLTADLSKQYIIKAANAYISGKWPKILKVAANEDRAKIL
jgi:hypothetical protein